MALTITNKLKEPLNGKAFRVYEIVHDGSTLSISAGSMDMTYVEAIFGHMVYMSMQAPASTFMKNLKVSINAGNSGVTWAGTDANAKSILTVIGW